MQQTAIVKQKVRKPRKSENVLPDRKMTPGMAIACFFLLIYFLLIAYPIFWLIMNSLKTYKEIYKNIWAMPQAPQWMNYVNAWNRGISRYFFNSVLVTGATIALTIFAASLGSYASGTPVYVLATYGSWSYVMVGGNLGYMLNNCLSDSPYAPIVPGPALSKAAQ